ncbi:MAG: hypothetical protein ACM3UY_00170 [Methanocella sp.]|jgi:hypothetical protein
MSRAWTICKKIFSVSLVFNSLLTIACATSLLSGIYLYYPGWKPFEPYLLDGSFYWFAIAAAIINIYPSAMVGRKLHTGRFLFHHYFYGLIVMIIAAIYIVFFTPVSLVTLFLGFNETIEVNLGRFFILGGLALLLDDLPDASKRIEGHLNWMKSKAIQIPRVIGLLQAITGGFAFYVSAALLWGMMNVPEWQVLANFIVLGTTLITAITSFAFLAQRFWHNVEPTQPKSKPNH